MIAIITAVVARLANLLLQEMPANAPTKDFTLVVEAKQAAGIPPRLTAKIPIPPFNPVSLVAAIAAATNNWRSHQPSQLSFCVPIIYEKWQFATHCNSFQSIYVMGKIHTL